MITLLAALALAADPWEGCTRIAMGNVDTMQCGGAFFTLSQGPLHQDTPGVFEQFKKGILNSVPALTPPEPVKVRGATISERWAGEIDGQATLLLAALQPQQDRIVLGACYSVDSVPGSAERCLSGLGSLLTAGALPEVPRQGPPPVQLDVAASLGGPFTAEGCEVGLASGQTLGACPDGLVLIRPAPAGSPLTPQSSFKALSGRLTGVLGATVVPRPGDHRCTVLGAEQPCLLADLERGGERTGTLVAAAHPVDQGALIFGCAIEGDVSRKACEQLLKLPAATD